MSSGLKARLEDLKDRFGRLSERERKMVLILTGVAAFLVVAGIGYWLTSTIGEIEQTNTAMREALADMAQHRDRYLQYQKRQDALRRATTGTPLELTSYAEQAATAVGIKIDEASETKPVEGKRYVRHGLDVKVRKINIAQLTALLRRLSESANQLVRITRLSVGTGWNKHEELDVEMEVTTYSEQKNKGKSSTSRSRRRRGGG